MRLARILISLCPLALPSLAGSITLTINYSPSVGTTPTLTPTMLIALALLLPVMAFRAMRKILDAPAFGPYRGPELYTQSLRDDDETGIEMAIRERADNVLARLWLQTLALVSASLALMLLFTWLIMRPIRQLERFG